MFKIINVKSQVWKVIYENFQEPKRKKVQWKFNRAATLLTGKTVSHVTDGL